MAEIPGAAAFCVSCKFNFVCAVVKLLSGHEWLDDSRVAFLLCFKMPHSDGAASNRKTLRSLFPPVVLPSAVASDTSPLQSKLLAYRRCKEQQTVLNQLL